MHSLTYVEERLLKSIADIRDQASMLAMDAACGATVQTAVARLRAIVEYADRAERLLAETPANAPLFRHDSESA